MSTEIGLYLVNDKKNEVQQLVPAASILNSPDLKRIRKAHFLYFEDDKLWVGTQQNGAFLFRKYNGKFRHVKHFIAGREVGKLGDNRVTSIQRDYNGNLWFATYKGLYRFNEIDSTFQSLNQIDSLSSKLVCDIILCSTLDKKSHLWFGTPCSLNKLIISPNNKINLKSYSKKDGLSDDYINGIIEGNDGLIWVSSNTGISSFNENSKQFLNYDKIDGLGNISYSEGATFEDNDGVLYFGGHSSLTFFDPLEIKVNQYNPPIVISKFTILNKEMAVSEEGFLNKQINEVEHFEFSYKEMEFSFEIAALDYKAPHKNQYSYRLLGSNSEWIAMGSNRVLSFSNLKSGDYQLQIKGTNSNGIWSSRVKEIGITVLPAPWKSVYALVVYVVIIMLVVVIISRIGVRQERLQNNIKIEKLHGEQIQKINDYKLRFFTNISHEFRTPLTLMLGPVKELFNKDISEITPAFFTNRMSMISYNMNRLYNLVNQLLEFRKLEANKVRLAVGKINLKEFIAEISLPFEQLAESKKIRYRNIYKAHEQSIFLDVERMSIVLNNLLSNAFKHVSDEGCIRVEVQDDLDNYTIDISNDGKPIPAYEVKHLFERFYQSEGNSSIGSTGIGLQLVKKYTELHKGNVSVKSDVGQPITFTLKLKKGIGHFAQDEITPVSKPKVIKSEIANNPTKRTVNRGTKGAKVLIVDDNAEIRDYLKMFLCEDYEVIESEDGLDAYEKIIDFKPDLIISDVMMPRMDGFELCEKVKENELTSHIPVILLTAKGSEQDQLFGKQKGADLYIKKPFLPDLLLEEIRQIISSRQRLKEKYSTQIRLETRDEELTSSEAKFIEKAIIIVEKQMGNGTFSPDVLANELAMSPSTFYRKIKKNTSQTPAGFIKTLRLKKAAQLLRDTDLSVTEIIERVGYLDTRNFRKNFKEIYNLPPLEYRLEKN